MEPGPWWKLAICWSFLTLDSYYPIRKYFSGAERSKSFSPFSLPPFAAPQFLSSNCLAYIKRRACSYAMVDICWLPISLSANSPSSSPLTKSAWFLLGDAGEETKPICWFCPLATWSCDLIWTNQKAPQDSELELWDAAAQSVSQWGMKMWGQKLPVLAAKRIQPTDKMGPRSRAELKESQRNVSRVLNLWIKPSLKPALLLGFPVLTPNTFSFIIQDHWVEFSIGYNQKTLTGEATQSTIFLIIWYHYEIVSHTNVVYDQGAPWG